MAVSLWGFLSVVLLLSGTAQNSELPGASAEGAGGSGVGDRFKIEGRAVVPGVKPQDWISAARVLVDGEEHVGFLKSMLRGKMLNKWEYPKPRGLVVMRHGEPNVTASEFNEPCSP